MRPADSSWRLVQSAATGKIYVEQSIDDTPVKYWDYDELGPAGASLLSSFIMAFDYGYNLRTQYPEEKDGKKTVNPVRKVLLGEAGGTPDTLLSRKASGKAVWFDKSTPEPSMPDNSTEPDEDMEQFLLAYLQEQTASD